MPEWLRKILGADHMRGYFINAVEISREENAEWFKIVPVGYFPNHHDGAHQIEFKHIQEMAANFSASKIDLLIDYEHRSLWGDSRAAGWGKEIEAREDGLYVKAPEFTKSASEMIANKEYRYFSPVYKLTSKDKLGREIGAQIISVGLTNVPYFDNEIDAIKNSKGGDMKLSKEALAKLGLAEDATEDQINAALEKLEVKPAEKPADAPAEKPAEKQPEGEAVNAKVLDTLEKINTRLAKLENAKTASDTNAADVLVNSAIAEGRITPAEKEFYLNSAKQDFSGTKAAIEARPKSKALPSKWTPPPSTPSTGSPSAGSGNGAKVNSHQAAAEYVRSLMN